MDSQRQDRKRGRAWAATAKNVSPPNKTLGSALATVQRAPRKISTEQQFPDTLVLPVLFFRPENTWRFTFWIADIIHL